MGVIVKWRGAKRWKILLGVIAIQEAVSAILAVLSMGLAIWLRTGSSFLNTMRSCSTIGTVVFLLLLHTVVLLDVLHRARRDWVHWLGIVCCGVGAAMSLAWEVFYAFFYHRGG